MVARLTKLAFLPGAVLALLGLQVLWACNQGLVVEATDPRLSISQNIYYLGRTPLTGELQTRAADIVRSALYANGVQEGRETTRHVRGQLLEERFFKQGARVGVHRGWYPSGSYRFHSVYSDGKLVGESWVWHENGQPYQYDRYGPDGTQLASKKWRSSGQIYYNLVFVEGKPVGLGGNSLCDPAQKSEGTE